MAQLPLQPLPSFDPDTAVGASLATRWKTWLDDFDTFLVASGISDTKQQRALLLYQAGSRIREIFKQIPDTGDADDFDTAKAKLTEYFEPQKNRRYEVFRFRQAKQEQGESLDKFHTRLRSLAETCEFANPDFEIEEQIIIAGTSSRIRKNALKDPKYTLKDMLLDGRRSETSQYQAREIESQDAPTATAHQVKTQPPADKVKKQSCGNCGGSFPHKGPCPAKGKECHKCGKLNHYASVCRGGKPRKRQNRTTTEIKPLEADNESDSSESDDYLYSLENRSHSRRKETPKTKVTVAGHTFAITVDTGASINVMDQETFSKLKGISLHKTNVKAYTYNATKPVRFLGKFDALVETPRRYTTCTFYVVNNHNSGCLLSSQTAQDLGLVSFHLNEIQKKLSATTSDKAVQKIVNKYPEVFTGIGKLKGHSLALNIDPEVIPQAQPQRRIPYHIRDKVEKAVKDLENDGIIEPVPDTQPTPWISPIVAVPKKDGSVRICVDMRMANMAIKRVRHLIPTVEDISYELNGAKLFSKLDLSQAYHQLELDEQSRHITTFSTHLGLFRYTRLNYGTNAASELFQHTLQQHLQGIKGVKNIADDILVFGSTREDHDRALEACLERLSEKGLVLNSSKCSFLQTELSFFGQIFSEKGTRPDPKRVEDLSNAAVPTNIQEVRSLLGMANYSAKYIPNFATITSPLRELTKKNAYFQWEKIHQKAFNKLKAALTTAPVMSYFDKSKDTILTVDASPVGVSGILAQQSKDSGDYRVLAYASRALTSVEKRYSQTEKEALSIVWAVEHFHLYLFGHSFTLITDHKPLETIYGHNKAKTSARIERWILRLQPYDFSVVYKSGASNPADYMSRHPTKASVSAQEKITEEYVQFLAMNAVPKAMSMEEIIKACIDDREMKGLRAAIKLNRWDMDTVKPFKSVKDELTIGPNNIILRGTRIVLPAPLRQRAIDIAHESHQGLSKTKALMREKVWFPDIDKLTKDTLDRCIPCQAVGQPAPPQPLKMSEMPTGPWQKIHIDFYGPMPTGEYLLVIVDRYSRFPIVEIVKSTKAKTIIPKLDKTFAVHGLPNQITTDNGPPFSSDEFKKYLSLLDIDYIPATPQWPQGNAEVERFMQPLGRAIQTARAEGRVWQQELSRFLLQYRLTPHCTTKVPPSELLFNRTIRGKLPTLQRKSIVDRHREACNNDQKKQHYNKEYSDVKRRVKDSDIAVGDFVLVKQQKKNKLTTRFDTNPYIVVERKGTQVIAVNKDQRKVKRNISHFKRIPKPENWDTDSDDDDDLPSYNSEQRDQGHSSPAIVRRSTRQRNPPDRFGRAIPSNILPS